MLEKLLWFAAGYYVARYLILRDGIETYKAKEAELISTVKEKTDSLTGAVNSFAENEVIDDNEYYPVEESEYANYY